MLRSVLCTHAIATGVFGLYAALDHRSADQLSKLIKDEEELLQFNELQLAEKLQEIRERFQVQDIDEELRCQCRNESERKKYGSLGEEARKLCAQSEYYRKSIRQNHAKLPAEQAPSQADDVSLKDIEHAATVTQIRDNVVPDIASLRWTYKCAGGCAFCYRADSDDGVRSYFLKVSKGGSDHAQEVKMIHKLGLFQHQHPHLHSTLAEFNDISITLTDGTQKAIQNALLSHTAMYGDLDDYLKQHGKFSGDIALIIIDQIEQGVRHIHSNDLIHTDLKTGNVFVTQNTPDMQVEVADFGQAGKMGAQPFGGTDPYANPAGKMLGKLITDNLFEIYMKWDMEEYGQYFEMIDKFNEERYDELAEIADRDQAQSEEFESLDKLWDEMDKMKTDAKQKLRAFNEQIRKTKEFDTQRDIWAVGMILWQLVSGTDTYNIPFNFYVWRDDVKCIDDFTAIMQGMMAKLEEALVDDAYRAQVLEKLLELWGPSLQQAYEFWAPDADAGAEVAKLFK